MRRRGHSNLSRVKPSLKELADAIGRSQSYFHRVFKAATRLTPKEYAAARRANKIRQGLASGNTVTGAMYDAGFNSSGRFYEKCIPKAHLVGADRDYEALVARVVGLVEVPGIGLDLPLDVRGTAFQQRVWQALQEIPIGETVSYTEIAQRIGSPDAMRAVAGACAANNLAVAIPCHRIVRKDGSLSGYAWGVERKRALLDHDRRH
jgi:AraC family transcriptional regulator of adaptative response/methylated-DNA-[protein]-cysteine methyltransferase